MSKPNAQEVWIGFYIDNLAVRLAQQGLVEASEDPLAVHESGVIYQTNPQALASELSPAWGKPAL